MRFKFLLASGLIGFACCAATLTAQACPNMRGEWLITEHVDATQCYGESTKYKVKVKVEMKQRGCTISFGIPDAKFSGPIKNGIAHMTGKYRDEHGHGSKRFKLRVSSSRFSLANVSVNDTF